MTPLFWAADVVLCMCRPYCRGSTRSDRSSATMREERVLSDWRVLRATREDHKGCDTFNTWMTYANTLLLLIQTALQGCAVASLGSTRSVSVCVVSRSVVRVVLRSQTIPTTNAFGVSRFCRQRVLFPSRNLAGTTLLRNYRVATCRLC